MEVAPRYTMLPLFTLLTLFLLFILFKLLYTAQAGACMSTQIVRASEQNVGLVGWSGLKLL